MTKGDRTGPIVLDRFARDLHSDVQQGVRGVGGWVGGGGSSCRSHICGLLFASISNCVEERQATGRWRGHHITAGVAHDHEHNRGHLVDPEPRPATGQPLPMPRPTQYTREVYQGRRIGAPQRPRICGECEVSSATAPPDG